MFHPSSSFSLLCFCLPTTMYTYHLCTYFLFTLLWPSVVFCFVLFCFVFKFQFEVRKMDQTAPRVEGLLEEAQKEAEEVVAEAEVISLLVGWILGASYSYQFSRGLLYLKPDKFTWILDTLIVEMSCKFQRLLSGQWEGRQMSFSLLFIVAIIVFA